MKRSVVLLSILLVYLVTIGSNVWAANSLSVVNTGDQKVELTSTLGVEQIKYFTLDAPKRLVVDLYGVLPGNHADTIALDNGFEKLRVGMLADKTRFVFDASGSKFPIFNVDVQTDRAVVSWDSNGLPEVNEAAIAGSAQITAIDFTSASGQSQLNIAIKGQADVTPVQVEGKKLLFSVKNTTLPRSLRREFDTLSFPSVIYSANAYLVNAAGRPEVRFVVQLKDTAPYRLQKVSDGYTLTVEDGAFAKAQPAMSGTLPIAVDGMIDTATSTSSVEMTTPVEMTVPVVDDNVIQTKSNKVYTGEKTSLVFDNADIRDILRLIAEISDLNIIASDQVKGEITLRLVNVPWDQALDLILDVSGLGMIQDGNVIRILPTSDIRKMKEEALAATRSQEKLEDLETEVITVSYADLSSVSGPAEKLLSDRGSITEDSRNKLLIVNDLQARIEKVKDLVNILDTPERQVMIEARIVEVNSDYSKELGVNWQGTFSDSGGDIEEVSFSGGGDYFLSDSTLGTSGIGAGISFGESLIDNFTLDLRLSALEEASLAKIISTPRVTTLNGEEAVIKQGVEEPYQTVEDGEVNTEYKEVVLSLTVTPVINPDNSIILEIEATNDSLVTDGDGATNTKYAKTKVLVRDGETTVLGGIFVESEGDADSGVPYLKDVPVLGNLFKSKTKTNSKEELLIFVTPHILSDK
jgi:type IV pilus assembly protein PilQ